MGKKDNIHELTSKNFDEFIKRGVVLIDFFAEWCMPCVMMGPIIDELSEKFEGRVSFGKVNVEDNQALAKRFSVSSIPNFIIFEDGKKIGGFVGSISAEEIEEKLEKFL
ncbi:MAG: thioredoxin [Nanoarchaeota archaeon]